MEIIRKHIPVMTLEQFADQNNLALEINERENPPYWTKRFYANFRNCEVKDGPLLCSAFGDGDTEEEAIEAYKKEIGQRCLVIIEKGSARREIKAPRFHE